MRPCWVEIRTHFLEDNFRFLASLAAPHAELLAIVKANAYGHSLAPCAAAAIRAGARWLGVTSVEEGVAARAVCPQARVLVIGGVFPGQGAELVRHGLTAVVWEPWQLDELESAAHAAGLLPGSLPVHLEIDTGMSRQGVDADGLGPLLARFTPGSPLRLEAVMTHLFAADEADGEVTGSQLRRLDATLERIGADGYLPDWLHVGNSAALVAGQAETIAELAGRHGMRAMMRPGLALYGLAPNFDPDYDPEVEAGEGVRDQGSGVRMENGSTASASVAAARARLKPVLSWKSRVVSVRSVPAGTVVGYNGRFVATEPMRLALVAAGYGDGLDRRLGNRFSLLVGGERAPIAGRISMDQTVVDVTEIPGVAPGDEVVLLGRQGAEDITAFDHAAATGTIPWEVFTRIGARVPRIEV
jgi:alanine racemase